MTLQTQKRCCSFLLLVEDGGLAQALSMLEEESADRSNRKTVVAEC